MPPETERNNDIVRLRAEGKTLRAIGRIVGLSVERVRGIYFREIHKRDKHSRWMNLIIMAQPSPEIVETLHNLQVVCHILYGEAIRTNPRDPIADEPRRPS